jgi:hypothetical protein
MWKGLKKIYALGILVYFAGSGVRALQIPVLSDWLYYMCFHALYAFVWPITWWGLVSATPSNSRRCRRAKDGESAAA